MERWAYGAVVVMFIGFTVSSGLRDRWGWAAFALWNAFIAAFHLIRRHTMFTTELADPDGPESHPRVDASVGP